MFTIKSEIQFDTAHYLSHYVGKCNHLHGHRYRLIAKVSAEELHEDGQLRGMVDDFGTLKTALKKIHDMWDHKLLLEDNEEGRAVGKAVNEVKAFDVVYVDYRPTAEEMSRHAYRLLKADGINVTEVELYETPTNSCTYTE